MTAPRPFRFSVVAPVLTDIRSWRENARRIADLGYTTLLAPDVPAMQPAVAPTLALAAADTDLRVGTWVYAAPLRPTLTTAREAHSLTVLTEGRFEMGIGTGRPGLADEVRALGLPVLGGSERLDQVREVVDHLRALDGDAVHTPVSMAVWGPRAQALALEVADTVTIAAPAGGGVGEREAMATIARDVCARRDVELAMHVAIVGDTPAPFMAGPGTDPAVARETDALVWLPDDPAAAVDTLRQRREELGYSSIVFGALVDERMAPVVAELAGR